MKNSAKIGNIVRKEKKINIQTWRFNMNVFSIGNGEKGIELTTDNFVEKTRKSFPFYQDPKKYKKPYFAICPECNNPIQIINLYGAKYEEENTGKVAIHGRHFPHNVKGLPDYNKDKYDNCPLHNPIAFHIVEIRNDTTYNEEILEIVKENKNAIARDIREITGVLLKNEKAFKIIDDYIIANDYCYTHTNKYNIPYSILYTREAPSLFGQRIAETPLGMRIKNAIATESQLFQINEGRIVKKGDEFANIILRISNHRMRDKKQYMTMIIEEEHKPNVSIIFQEDIELKQYAY